jgi:uncharacterized alpha-E superfamily protein
MRGIGLRVFAIATARGYRVLPGGLTRVAAERDPLVVSMQRGGSAKDTWVLVDGAPGSDAPLAAPGALAPGIARRTAITPSRTVENLFWFGRYAERCEDLARLLRVALNAGLQETDLNALPLADLGARVGLSLDAGTLARDWCAAATLDTTHGLPASLRQLARVAHSLRERISLDHWRAINRLAQDPALGRRASVAEAIAWLDRAVQAMVTLSGFVLDGMTRDLAWRFLSIGRRIERLSFSCLALEVALTSPAEHDLAWLLELGDSIVTYRARQTGRMEWPSILSLLVFDETNPRSLMFQVAGIDDYLGKLEAALGPCGARRTAPLVAEVRAVGAGAQFDHGLEALRARMAGVAQGLRGAAWALSDDLGERFFAHADRESHSAVSV